RRGVSRCLRSCLVAVLVLLSLSSVRSAWAQNGTQGTVIVTVVDPAGRVVPGANLELRDLSTNDVRKAITSEKGSYTFVNLSLGKFSLTISKDGFESEIHHSVVSEAAQTTSVNATLKVGVITETIEVNAAATPVLETMSNALG